MTKTVKNQLLRNLYNLKSFGYEYHETLDFFSSEVKNFKLPNNLDALKNSVEHCYLCELCKSRKNILRKFLKFRNSKINNHTIRPPLMWRILKPVPEKKRIPNDKHLLN